jgi:hypothetical protein
LKRFVHVTFLGDPSYQIAVRNCPFFNMVIADLTIPKRRGRADAL